MVQYPNDCMMATIVASTTLIGLTGVVIGQVRTSDLPITKRGLYSRLLSFLSIALGLFAILAGLIWFTDTIAVIFSIAAFLFAAQLVSFWLITFWFWVIET